MTPDRKAFNLLVETWPVSEAVKNAIKQTDRSLFVPHYRVRDHQESIYRNEIVPINNHSSMSQPLLVAVMTEYLQLEKGMRVLEVGTASGYQAALLAHIIGENGSVTTVEYDRLLAREAQSRVNNLGYTNITVYEGDGLVSIPGMKPFDRIISTACAKSIPPAWKEQLSGGGILVSPIGFDPQDASLIRAIKNDSTGVMDQDDKGKVNFFPLLSQEEGGFSHNDLRKLFRAKEALLGERAAMVALRPRDYIMICAMNEKVSYSDYVERVKIPKERWAEFIGENESRGY